MKPIKIFNHYPVPIPNAHTGRNVTGFKFPANEEDGYDFENPSDADSENLQQFQLYFGVNTVIASLKDLIKLGTDKTRKIYEPLLEDLIEHYDEQCVSVLSLASSLCWVPVDTTKTGADRRYMAKLTPDQALYEIEPAMKGLLLAIQRKMDLTFPLQIVKNVGRLDIEKELVELEETTGTIKKSLKR